MWDLHIIAVEPNTGIERLALFDNSSYRVQMLAHRRTNMNIAFVLSQILDPDVELVY